LTFKFIFNNFIEKKLKIKKMKKLSKKQKQKEKIFSLAEDATSKIIKNKIISSQIINYSKYLEFIKSFINKLSANNKLNDKSITNNTNVSLIKNELNSFIFNLKANIELLKSENNKLGKKYKTNHEKYFAVNSSNKIVQEDAFILSYSLTQKLNIIKKLKQSIHTSKDYNIFQEPKRETLIDIRIGEENIERNNDNLQKLAFNEIKQFNKYYNRTQRKLKKINFFKKRIQVFNQIINYFRQNNNRNNNIKTYSDDKRFKISKTENDINDYYNNNLSSTDVKNKKPQIKKIYTKEDDDLETNININLCQTFNNIDMNPSTNDTEIFYSLTKSQIYNDNNDIILNDSSLKKKKTIKIPTVEELFDVTNNEGEKEEIIDDELHSDEEVVFQPKVKQNKKIIKNYLPKIQEQIPKISLSLIEYNKIKIMNDADLYSYNKRQEQRGNPDENIKILKKKLKIIKRRCILNQKKLETLQNFVKECENDYNTLKSMKVQMSVKDKNIIYMKKDFFIADKIDEEEDEYNYQKELNEYLNDPELNDPYFEQFQNLQTDITHRPVVTENNIIRKISNAEIDTKKDIIEKNKKYEKLRTHRERKKEKTNRANSK
jgi:hypothetical protein